MAAELPDVDVPDVGVPDVEVPDIPGLKPALLRPVPDGDIFEKQDFGDETVNKTMNDLRSNLFTKLRSLNIKDQCVTYNNLGTAYYRLFNFDKAEICFNVQYKLAQPIEVPVPFQEKRQGYTDQEKSALINIGSIYRIRRLYEPALAVYRKALDLADQLGDEKSKARILNNISNVYEEVLDFDSAIDCQLQRMEIVNNLCDVDGQIKCAATLGGFYQLTGDIRESIMNYQKAVINLRMKIVKNQLDALEQPEG